MLLDSNIIIYAAKPEYPNLREFIAKYAPAVSAISYVEVLGYHGLNPHEQKHFENFFGAARILDVSGAVIQQATKLRQIKRITLGDSLIAATAIVHSLTLITRNTRDFDWVDNLSLLNPL